jgi:putative membrane protein insertion efficiency factor
MIYVIDAYKELISPLLSPNCRFVPTCSSYGEEAIEKFGGYKGGILLAWRLMRCNPTGGSGYDPPRWPPPLYSAGGL